MSKQQKAQKEELLPQFNVVVIGSGGTGKSCITNQFVTGVFTEDYDPTIEDSYRKRVNVDGDMCVLDILDTAGQEEYSSMLDEYLRHGQGFIIVYSIISNQSFLEVQNFKDKLWLCKDLGQNDTIPLILVGNKCDLETERKVTTTEGQELAKHFKCPFFETSAKTGTNVHELFHEIVRQVRKDIERKGITPNRAEAPNDAYMAKLMKKFERWTLGLHLKEKMKSAKDQIKKVGSFFVNRTKSEEESSSGISSPTPANNSSHTPTHTSTPSHTPTSNPVSAQSSYPTSAQSSYPTSSHSSTPVTAQQPSDNYSGLNMGTPVTPAQQQERTTPKTAPGAFSYGGAPGGVVLKSSANNPQIQSHSVLLNSTDNAPKAVNTYGKIPKLETPQAPSFHHYPWFYSNMSGGEADNILLTAAPGTFLIRPSSQPDHLAVTYVGDNRNLNKALIAYDKEGKNFWMAAEENPLRYPTLGRLVESLNSILRIPYVAPK